MIYREKKKYHKSVYLATEAICVVQWLIRTLVLLWLVLIGSKDLDGGETSDAILTTQ